MSEKNIFKSHIFSGIKQESLYKRQMMDGFEDKTLHQFAPLAFSAVAKQEYKYEMFESEFIDSFLEAAKMLAKASRHNSVPMPGVYVFYKYSLVLPVLYMVRHCMELSIKRAIRLVGGNPKRKHKLDGLWSSFLSKLPKERTSEDEEVLRYMHDFVKYIDLLDDNGEKLRYPEGNDQELSQDIFYWVDSVAVTETLDCFVKQLNALVSVGEKGVTTQ